MRNFIEYIRQRFAAAERYRVATYCKIEGDNILIMQTASLNHEWEPGAYEGWKLLGDEIKRMP